MILPIYLYIAVIVFGTLYGQIACLVAGVFSSAAAYYLFQKAKRSNFRFLVGLTQWCFYGCAIWSCFFAYLATNFYFFGPPATERALLSRNHVTFKSDGKVVTIENVERGGFAAKLHLAPGDIVRRFDDEEVDTVEQALAILPENHGPSPHWLTYEHKGQTYKIQLPVGTLESAGNALSKPRQVAYLTDDAGRVNCREYEGLSESDKVHIQNNCSMFGAPCSFSKDARCDDRGKLLDCNRSKVSQVESPLRVVLYAKPAGARLTNEFVSSQCSGDLLRPELAKLYEDSVTDISLEDLLKVNPDNLPFFQVVIKKVERTKLVDPEDFSAEWGKGRLRRVEIKNDRREHSGGLKVMRVEPGSLFEQMNLRLGDLIFWINGGPIGDPVIGTVLKDDLMQSRDFRLAVLRDGTAFSNRYSFEY